MVHNVYRPVIQEVNEVIQPYRKVLQTVEPVIEQMKTIISKAGPAPNEGYPQQQQLSMPTRSNFLTFNGQSDNHVSKYGSNDIGTGTVNNPSTMVGSFTIVSRFVLGIRLDQQVRIPIIDARREVK